jgi:DNA-binding CsgD family transcriptional regulator
MIDIDSFSSAIAQIYDAALDVERWDDVLATLARLFNSSKSQISYFTSYQDADPFIVIWGFDPSIERHNISRYTAFTGRDPRNPPRLFKAYRCRDLVSDESLWASDMYKEALAPANVEYAMYFALLLDDGANCGIGVMRGRDQPPFTKAECEDLGRFIPHVARAANMHGVLSRARGEIAAARALIDSVPLGMMVVQNDRVVVANKAALAFMERGETLRCSDGRLHATTPQAQTKLGRAMRDARDGRDCSVGITLPAGETEQIRVMARQLAPASADMFGVSPKGLALYLADSRRSVETREETLRRLFGLTAREATALSALVQGDDTRQIAARLGIGVETAKTHLRHVMQAVGVKRQIDLIRLVLSSPAWIGDPGVEWTGQRTKSRGRRSIVGPSGVTPSKKASRGKR